MAELEPESAVVSDDTESGGGSDEQNVTTTEGSTGDYDYTDPDSVSQHSEGSTPGAGEPADEGSPGSSQPDGGFDTNLLAIAESLGYPRDVALAFGSQEALKRHLTQDVQNRRDVQTYRNQPAPPQQQQQQQPQQQPVEEPYMVPKYDMQFDPDVYATDDPMVQQFNALNEHYQQVAQGQWDWINHFRQEHQAISEQFQQQQAVYDQQQQQAVYQSNVDTFDRVVSGMEEYAEVLGAGRTSDINKSSDQWGNRDKLFRLWSSLEDGYRNAGLQLPPDNELARQAAQSLFGAQLQAEPNIEPTNGDRLRNEKGQFLAGTITQRPTHRKGKSLGKGMEKATATADSWYDDPERAELLNQDADL